MSVVVLYIAGCSVPKAYDWGSEASNCAYTDHSAGYNITNIAPRQTHSSEGRGARQGVESDKFLSASSSIRYFALNDPELCRTSTNYITGLYLEPQRPPTAHHP